MESQRNVELFGVWDSPFVYRVIWALKVKGIEYNYIVESLMMKSPLLLQYSPVYKKVPVLVHDGKPVLESAFILEYIDEVWSRENPILPREHHERAAARFWACFADEMVSHLNFIQIILRPIC